MSFTLQIKGKLRAPNQDPALQRELDRYVPYEYILQWIRTRMSKSGMENRVLAIKAGTGSGKTVTIPSEIYINFIHEKTHRGIICTQPRILTTKDNAREIARIPRYQPYLALGRTLGWSTRHSKLRMRKQGLLMATNTTLATMLSVMENDSEMIDAYQFIIIDEAHERSLGADLVYALTKSFLLRNCTNVQCPFVILMSATINPRRYIDYFVPNAANPIENIILCEPNPTYERKIVFANESAQNLITESVRIVEKIMEDHPVPRFVWDAKIPRSPDGDPSQDTARQDRDDILIFVPGIEEIQALTEALDDLNKKRKEAGKTLVCIVPLDRFVVVRESPGYINLSRSLYDAYGIYERRVIVSTNVSETGKTFASLRYVLDFGFSREIEYNPNIDVSVLLSKPAPLSRIEQRAGRVARRFPGEVYHLYTSTVAAKLPVQQMPEIINADISSIILSIVYNQQREKFAQRDESYFRIADIDLMDLPHPDTLLAALESAHVLGLIARNPPLFSLDFATFMSETKRAGIDRVGLTKMGRIANELREYIPSLKYARFVLAGFAHGYRIAELILIAVCALNASTTSFIAGSKEEAIDICEIYNDALVAPEGVSSCETERAWVAILGDTFIQSALVASVVEDIYHFSEGNPEDSVRDWCNERRVNPDSVISFLEKYYQTCDKFIEMGFDISDGLSILDIVRESNETGMAPCADTLSRAIIGYKRCLYDGFRQNIVTWNDDANAYVTQTGMIIARGLIERTLKCKPQVAILDSFSGRAKKGKEIAEFDIFGKFASALDGFVGHDDVFPQ